ncbi:hypothetical protein L1887_13803 [Cichorium endivia]|nr:hypothetical protein L1887_13803 [Cichorium endivia]
MNYILGAFKPSCHISITLNDAKTRKQVPLKKENGQMAMVPLFQSQESIAGKICVDPVQGKKVERNGIKIELLGQIEIYFDRGNFCYFTSLVREVDKWFYNDFQQHVFPSASSSFLILTVFSSFLFPTDYSSWIYRHAVDSFCPFACL